MSMTLQEIVDKTNRENTFMIEIGARFTQAGKGHAVIELKLENKHKNINGYVHGGVMLTMIDSAAGGAARTCGGRLVTLEMKTNFIRGIKADGQTIRAVADVLHAGATTRVCEVKLYDGEYVACAALVTMYVTDSEPTIEY